MAVERQHDVTVAGARQTLGAVGNRARQRLLRGAAERLRLGALGLRIGREAKTLQLADMMALDHHVARRRDFRFQHRILPEAAHQHAGPPIDKPFDQPLMQSVRQTILDSLRFIAPLGRFGKPVRLVGDKGPGADLRDARRQRVDIAFR